MTTPTGRPAWARSVSHADYGGHTNKRNYQSQGVVNPRTDVGAEGFTRLVADAEATTRTAPMITLRYTNRDASTDTPLVLSAYMMIGVSLSGYEGDLTPDDFPSGVRNGNGDVTFTFEEEFADAYGITEPFVPTQCLVSVEGTTAAHATYVISGQTVRVRCWDAAGAAVANKNVTLTVW
jgi:hypothetical protein